MEDWRFNDWEPLSLEELRALLATLPVPWHLAGGHAIEVFLGKSIRVHGDIDILVERKDQLILQDFLSDWEMAYGTRPGMDYWQTGQFLEQPYYDIWCRKQKEGSWKFQIMLYDAAHDNWLFKRDASLRRPKSKIFHNTEDGLSYLAPEIQLLYKGTSTIRPKDNLDFKNVLPFLNQAAKTFLKIQLENRYPDGHSWLADL